MMAENTYSVLLQPAGWRFETNGEATLMEAARCAGIALPASCRNGTCRTCICILVEGRIRHRIEWPGLSAEEKRDGYILPCVACAESDLTLLVPGARKLPAG
ncbi:MAG TPA: 2Fe-2S iron-sulfur cluster-binding protein [Noviherbaspirillum sp.]|jgi:ferredoxin|uniref:2Fe-2S iron-sulfur cluster-binding protein n=1 Tax=Noviherbaspirillum sp. TaxID=1926288 RepID=UPI002F927CFB